MWKPIFQSKPYGQSYYIELIGAELLWLEDLVSPTTINITKYHRLCGLNHRHLFLTSSGDWEVPDEDTAWSGLGEDSFSGL